MTDNVNLVVDCETMGTAEDAIILQFAFTVVPFGMDIHELREKHSRSWKLAVSPQQLGHRTTDESTMHFWQKHADTFRKVGMPTDHDIHPRVALQEAAEFLKLEGVNANSVLWQRGSKDLDWLTSLSKTFDTTALTDVIAFWQVMDIRTALNVLGFSSKCNGYMDTSYIPAELYKGFIGTSEDHDASSDVIRDVLFLRVAGLV